MSEYKTIFGKAVKALASDPTDTGAEGQIWYNTTTGSFRTVLSVGSWSAGGSYSTGRRSLGSAGTQTANLIFGGYGPAAISNATEEYNGASWTAGGTFGASAYGIRGMGTQTAALSAGEFLATGVNTGSYEYDGSSWTAGGSLPANRAVMGTAGTQTTGLAFGGSSGPFAIITNNTYEYNGTSWTVGNNLGTGRSYVGGFGTQTAAVGCGGYTASPGDANTTGATEEYDGTNWTTSGAMNTARRTNNVSGIQTAGLTFGGYVPPNTLTNVTESYDGSNWTTTPATLATATGNGGGSPAGTVASALSTEGGNAPYGATTEEYNLSIYSPIAATWASGGNLSTARYGSVGAGTSQDAALVAAGTQAPAYTGQNATEEYNGSTWGAGGNYPLSGSGQRGCGSLTAALGTTPTSTNTYDGSTWTNLGAPSNLNTPRAATWLVGSSTAGLIWGGNSGPTRYNVTEEWDGSAWTTSPGTLSDSVSGTTGFGIQTAAIRVAGDLGPSNSTNVDSYNGTTWTASTAYPIAIKDSFGTGTQTDGLVASGAGGPGGTDVVTTVVSAWNGSSWSTTATMGTSRRDNTGGSTSGPATAAVQAGGNNPPTTSIANTEEFTGEIPALDYKTITTS